MTRLHLAGGKCGRRTTTNNDPLYTILYQFISLLQMNRKTKMATNIDCFVRIAPVTMDVNYGRSLRIISLTYAPRGAKASVQSGIYRIPHTVIYCLFFCQYLYLSSMNSVVVQSTLRVHACRTSPNSLVRLHHIVYTLLAVSHQWVRI